MSVINGAGVRDEGLRFGRRVGSGRAVLWWAIPFLLLWGQESSAREYNKPEGLGHEQQSKISRTLADANRLKAQGVDVLGVGGVTNVGCGGLSIGNVESTNNAQALDRDIIITGDVINIASGCK